MRLSPPSTVPTRAVTISVDLPDDGPSSAVRVEDIVSRLLPVFSAHAVPVTWGMTDVRGQLATQILSADSGHQVDLLINGARMVSTAARGSFRRQLEDAVQDADRAGHEVVTAVLRNAEDVPHQDLLIKHGISLLASDRRRTTGESSLSTLRYGLWEIPAAISLPSMAARTSGHRLRRLLDREIGRDELLHLALDGPAVAATTSTTRSLERLLRHIDRRRTQDRIQVFTASEIVALLKPHRRTPAAHSILRIAAQQRRAA